MRRPTLPFSVPAVLPLQRRMGAPVAAIRERVAGSPNYRDGQFQSHEPAHWVVAAEAESPASPLLTAVRHRNRGKPVGAIPLGEPSWPADVADLAVTWLGHATSLVELDGRRFLLDPVWGDRASPSVLVGPKRTHPVPVTIAALPPLDAVVISHDHYDHLDAPSIAELERTHRPHYVVPIGVDLHLRAWAVPEARITALDWREETEVGGIRLTCAEARHFSGRGTLVRNQTLWAAWSLRGPRHGVFFGGDSGPTHRYADIGTDLGPYDLTIIPIGAYSHLWPEIHLDPEQAVSAHLELNGGATASVMLPIHWATFNLAMHWWSEPIRRTRRAATAAEVSLLCPVPGARVDLGGDAEEAVAAHQRDWWAAAAARDDRD